MNGGSPNLEAGRTPPAGGAAALTPTTVATELQRQLPDAARAVFEATAADPFVGVAVLSDTGRIEYMNDQCARLFVGTDARAADLVGRTLAQCFPSECALESEEAMHRVRNSHRAVSRRKLWLGSQLFINYSYLTELPGAPGRGAFLMMVHHVGGDARSVPHGPEVDRLESGVVRLGRLDCLTAQELRVMALIGAGLSVRETAKAMHRAEKTVESHCVSIHRKLKINDRVEMATLAHQAGLTLADADRRRV
ncbi:MAG: PAS domain-containing protein [Phycisphaerales bacterium]|nr:PAS domain-containing protein [Phycisphaerales bacterium]